MGIYDFERIQVLQGRFLSLEECKSAAQEFNKGTKSFTSSRWYERQMFFWREAFLGIAPRSTSLPKIFKDSDADIVVEIGGGSAWVWNLIKEFNKRFTYYNLELPEMVEYFESLFKEFHHINFVSDINSIVVPCRSRIMLYSNSTLQYLDENELFRVMSCKLRYQEVLLDDLIFTNARSFWTLQEYYGSKIPYLVRNRNEFLSIMNDMKFKGKTIGISSELPISFEVNGLKLFTESMYFNREN